MTREPGSDPPARAPGSPVWPWFLVALATLELGARLATRPESLLALHVSGYSTCYAHRKALARGLSGPPVTTLVVGDSTAERGLDACALGAATGGRGAGLSFPSGTVGEAAALHELASPHLAPDAHVVLAVNPLNIRTYSEWVTPTFSDLRGRTDVASALLGQASTLFRDRKVVLAVLESLVERERYAEEFRLQIGVTGECGRETPPPRPDEVPDAAARERQVREYGTTWIGVFKEPVGSDQEAALAAALAPFRGRRTTIVLTPLRADFRDFLEREHPGTIAARRRIWAAAAHRAGATLLTCHDAIEDASVYVDPVHLDQNGRVRLSTCLGARLAGAGGCCSPVTAVP